MYLNYHVLCIVTVGAQAFTQEGFHGGAAQPCLKPGFFDVMERLCTHSPPPPKYEQKKTTTQADGTRSGSLSIAIAAFQSFVSHPDHRLAATGRRALAVCGAILYPRAAPLHLPHAVTSQARAWGGGVGAGSGSGSAGGGGYGEQQTDRGRSTRWSGRLCLRALVVAGTALFSCVFWVPLQAIG